MGGREFLSKNNFYNLKKIYTRNFYYFKLENRKIEGVINYFKAFLGYIDGINEKSLIKLEKLIKLKKIDIVFLDGSNLGACAKFVKKKFPNIRIIIYFHNVEAIFFYDSMITEKTIKSFFIFLINYFVEKKSIKYGDRLISLTKYDSRKMSFLYKRCADTVIPLSIKSKKIKPTKVHHVKNNFLIFVGGNFYGNLKGINWFVKNILPFLNCNLLIVGKGFSKSNFFLTKKIHFIGKVKNLDKWYNKSFAAIAPIFLGSGMKTKVAESLMHGKPIFGTSKAFEGYEDLKKYKNIAIKCDNPKEFIYSINKKINQKKNMYNKKAIILFKKFYSSESNYKYFLNFFIKNKLI